MENYDVKNNTLADKVHSENRMGKYPKDSFTRFAVGTCGLPEGTEPWQESLISEGVFAGTHMIWTGYLWVASLESEYKYGIHCGYPQCCVESYCEGRTGIQLFQEYPDVKFNLGYVPCRKCCEMILREREKNQLKEQGDAFVKHLEYASTVVQTWPNWKQQMLGGTGQGE